MSDVRAQYPQQERRERRKDRYLGAGVGSSAVGLSLADRNLSRSNLDRISRASRSSSLTINGRSYPATARVVAGLRSAKGVTLKQLAAAGLLGLVAGGGRMALRERDTKHFVAKADTWKELKSQTVYGMPSHQVARLGARGRSEAMARSIPDPALPFVAPKGERRKAAQAQAKATASGVAVGTTAGAAAGALVGGPKTWKRSGKSAAKALKQLKGLTNAKKRPAQLTLPGMKPTRSDRLATLKRKAGERFTAQRRADLVRGAVGGAVTGAAVNINSANAAKQTVESNPKAWERNDRKIQRFVSKGEPMPSLAEIAKASRKGDETQRKALTAGALTAAGGGGLAAEIGMENRTNAKTNRTRSAFNARVRNANMDVARRHASRSQQTVNDARRAYGTGSYSSAKARGMADAASNAGQDMATARRHFAYGREAGRTAALQRVKAGRQARSGKRLLIGGGLAMGSSIPMAIAANRKKPVTKGIEPDIDPDGFLVEQQRRNESLRGADGRFAGKVVDDVGPTIVAAPYSEGEA